uniref:Tripartite motif containing 59 n=1 Tax=Monodelphis domestica TaxID=13616 RepID=F7B2M8_MONDO
MLKFEEELMCPICYSIFEDPRVLPCSHTFCRKCLENVLQVSENVFRQSIMTCPTCRYLVEFPPRGIDSLPINFALRAIIEKCKKEDHPDGITCPEHFSQPLNMYCLQDRQPVCGHCLTIGQHQGHPIEDLQSAYMKEKEEPLKLFKQLTEGPLGDVSLLLEKLEEQKSHVEQIIQSDKETVLQYFKELNGILDLKKNALLSSLDDTRREIDKEYTPQIDRMKEIREEYIKLQSCTAFLGDEESPLKFLEKFHSVRQWAQALKQKKVPSVQPLEICPHEIYPRIGSILNEEWARTEISEIKKLEVPKIKLSVQRIQFTLLFSWAENSTSALHPIPSLLQQIAPTIIPAL